MKNREGSKTGFFHNFLILPRRLYIANYIQIGAIGAGMVGYFDDLGFDFAGLVDDVHYVKVVRESAGPQSGRFIDAVGGVPEPATMLLLACGSLGVLLRRRTGDG